jgi:hypothetical protein
MIQRLTQKCCSLELLVVLFVRLSRNTAVGGAKINVELGQGDGL